MDFRHFRNLPELAKISAVNISDYSGHLYWHCRRYQKNRCSTLSIICRNCQRYRNLIHFTRPLNAEIGKVVCFQNCRRYQSIAGIVEFAENVWILANTRKSGGSFQNPNLAPQVITQIFAYTMYQFNK